MVDYEGLYLVLFNGLTDAIREMEQQNYGVARLALIRAQQTAEDMFIAGGEEDEGVG